MFSNFDFSLLKDPNFKEGSVREEIIVPILNRLGYSASGEHKITRSKSLKHPFVHIGTKSNRINIIPDYILHAGASHKWILDAKSPGENLLSGKNPEQAFSYAIHPEVRATKYALCNGENLVVYEINKFGPVINIEITKIDENWDSIVRALSPTAFIKPQLLDYKPDFGIYQWKIGATEKLDQHFIPLGVPFIAKVTDDLYTFCVNILFGEDYLAASFDFDRERFEQLMKVFPKDKELKARECLSRQPFQVSFETDAPEVNVHARLGTTVNSNEDEDYCPLIVESFS